MFRKLMITVVLLTLALPAVASAQTQYPPTSTTGPPGTTTTLPGVTTTTNPGVTTTTNPGVTTTTKPGVTTTTKPGVTSTTKPGVTSTTKPGPEATTTTVDGKPAPTTPRQPPRQGGVLPRTGADALALLVRIGMALLVGGFIFALAERNRRAEGAGGPTDTGGGNGIA